MLISLALCVVPTGSSSALACMDFKRVQFLNETLHANLEKRVIHRYHLTSRSAARIMLSFPSTAFPPFSFSSAVLVFCLHKRLCDLS